MAQLDAKTSIGEWIDDYLEYLWGEWDQLPGMAAEWDEWDKESRLTFAEDWGVPADRLAQLRGWAAEGLLTPAQQQRYDALLALVARNGETLAYLLKC
jgi:hypothetical protein